MKAEWVSVLAAVAAAVSALVGLFVGFEQLATASRLRREATFWLESLQAATSEEEKLVLQTLHRTAIARIFSLRLVPIRRILSTAYYMVLPLAMLFALTWITPELIIPFASNLWTGPAALLVSAMILYLGILRMATTLAEQRRMVGAYLD
ncbi:hypothetical protein [Pseudarthrobacter sp. LMD1-1-1.1]|uniref:hypothetical protein n=1 Tax=Pseudarthrobacter sp. LMD1-1-1.1 TaxID=3135242 RepID=UPI00343AFDC5